MSATKARSEGVRLSVAGGTRWQEMAHECREFAERGRLRRSSGFALDVLPMDVSSSWGLNRSSAHAMKSVRIGTKPASRGLGSKKCPRCGSLNVRRSGFQSQDEEQIHVFTSPYRCEECSERFWVLNRKTRHAMIWILVLLIASVTIAWLIPTGAPPPPTRATPTSGAIVLPDVRVSRASEIVHPSAFYAVRRSAAR